MNALFSLPASEGRLNYLSYIRKRKAKEYMEKFELDKLGARDYIAYANSLA